MRLVLFTIALAMGAVSATNGQTVNIGGFEFGGCVDSSGDRHAPKFGENIGGTVNVDISTKWGRENCKLIVQRTIEICRQNTGFASNTKNDELAGCLPIFEARSKACVAHFRHEMQKCGLDPRSGTADPAGGSPVMARNVDMTRWGWTEGIGEGPTVDGKPHGIWRVRLQSNDGVGEGRMEHGITQGRWTFRYPNGVVWAGVLSASGKWSGGFVDR